MFKVAYHADYVHHVPENHRFPMAKYGLIFEQIQREGIAAEEHFVSPDIIDLDLVGAVHDPEYIRDLLELRLDPRAQRKTGFVHNKQLVQRELRIMEGTRLCAESALKYGAALNIAGGTHHAYTNRGEGFCLLNDQAIAAKWLMDNNLSERIAVIDLDVHQGNGTAEIFQEMDSVMTLSVHGRNNYPLHKEVSDIDIALEDNTSDEEYLGIVGESLENVRKFRPDFIFYQCGVDVLQTDKLGKLGLSIEGCRKRDEMVLQFASNHNLPVVCTMGGGYSAEIKTIVNAHVLSLIHI